MKCGKWLITCVNKTIIKMDMLLEACPFLIPINNKIKIVLIKESTSYINIKVRNNMIWGGWKWE